MVAMHKYELPCVRQHNQPVAWPHFTMQVDLAVIAKDIVTQVFQELRKYPTKANMKRTFEQPSYKNVNKLLLPIALKDGLKESTPMSFTARSTTREGKFIPKFNIGQGITTNYVGSNRSNTRNQEAETSTVREKGKEAASVLSSTKSTIRSDDIVCFKGHESGEMIKDCPNSQIVFSTKSELKEDYKDIHPKNSWAGLAPFRNVDHSIELIQKALIPNVAAHHTNIVDESKVMVNLNNKNETFDPGDLVWIHLKHDHFLESVADMTPYSSEKEAESRTTLLEEGENDEDILASPHSPFTTSEPIREQSELLTREAHKAKENQQEMIDKGADRINPSLGNCLTISIHEKKKVTYSALDNNYVGKFFQASLITNATPKARLPKSEVMEYKCGLLYYTKRAFNGKNPAALQTRKEFITWLVSKYAYTIHSNPPSPKKKSLTLPYVGETNDHGAELNVWCNKQGVFGKVELGNIHPSAINLSQESTRPAHISIKMIQDPRVAPLQSSKDCNDSP